MSLDSFRRGNVQAGFVNGFRMCLKKEKKGGLSPGEERENSDSPRTNTWIHLYKYCTGKGGRGMEMIIVG